MWLNRDKKNVEIGFLILPALESEGRNKLCQKQRF
jgi:hypothetical protein